MRNAPVVNNQSPLESLIGIVYGLLDWAVLIAMLVLPSIIEDYRIVFGVVFGLGVIFLIYNWYKFNAGQIKVFPKLFEVGIVLINLALLIFEIVAMPSYDWSSKWTSVIINSALLGLVLFGMLVQRPFTVQFAMEKVPEEFWGTPHFMCVNYVITAVWALEFALSVMFALLYIYVYYGNSAARIAPNIIILVGALKFTSEFPKYMRERAAQLKANSVNASSANNMENVVNSPMM